ncbi:MAG: winged helix DNA-binding domain-containing protein [Verrucomicrobiales bacterium]|nr:winged helix DNA-binding domain-containing protein [Verrucomicrobiales bacterium]
MLLPLRRIALSHQGLTTARPFGKSRQATLAVLERLGYIQIDTLAVIERAHHHTLWTRIPDYQPDHLHQLVRERRAFEYWSHAASYLPMRDYRFVLPQMAAIKRGESPYSTEVDEKYLRHVSERIRNEGPLKARHFKSATTKQGKWWNWKPAKRALEKLFMQGNLMITRRDGMEKVYDLSERVLPQDTNTREPSLMEFAEYLLNTSLSAHGFTTLKQLTHLRSGLALRKALNTLLQEKIAAREIRKFTIECMPPVYAPPDIFEMKLRQPTNNVRLLSPFDNAIIHRDRMQQLFAFDYRLECYTPKAKRQIGYFCLPILYQDNLIGRVDCKAHRKTGHFELIHLHLESTKIDLDHFMFHFSKTVQRFSKFNHCHTITASKVTPKKLTSSIKKLFF